MERYFTDPYYRHRMKKVKRVKKSAFYVVVLAACVVFAALSVLYVNYIIDGLPSLERLENPKPELASKVYASDGELLGQFFVKNRSRVLIDSLPKKLVPGLIATEDKAFYDHWGVHLSRVVRALVKNIIHLNLTREGASTITQQLSRNLYLKPDRHVFDKITRKFRELFTSVQIERNFTKQEILELYLNVNYFGRGAYGIEAAAETFFNKSSSQLKLSEYAMLIGMLKGPGYYDPIIHPQRTYDRRDVVLGQMVRDGIITPEEAAAARADAISIKFEREEFPTGIAPHFIETIRQQMLKKSEQYGFDILRDGLQIYSTLDSRIQRHAIKAVEDHLAEFQKAFDATWKWEDAPDILRENVDKQIRDLDIYKQAKTPHLQDSIMMAYRTNKIFIDSAKVLAKTIEVGVVVINPHNGNIVAMVGGRNFRQFRYGLNHVTQIRRQPGSAFKVFVYTVAIDNGYPVCYELLNQPVTVVNDDGTRWTPQNIEQDFGGKYTIREAVRLSKNLIAVRAVLEIAPVKEVVEYAHRMGIKSHIPPFPSIALGTASVSPLEMTSAVGVLANKGVRVEPVSLLRIEDKDGNLIEAEVPEQAEVLSVETAYIMTNLLEGAVNTGTGTRVRWYFHYPAAGKTGTTNDYTDAWFIGYTPDLAAGIWVGFDDNRIKFTTSDGQGGRAAAPIFGRLMQAVYDDPSIGMTVSYFSKPEGVVRDTICVETKKKATEFCPSKTTEIINSRYPLPPCDVHTTADWNKEKNTPSTINW